MFGAAQHIKNLLFISKEKKRVLCLLLVWTLMTTGMIADKIYGHLDKTL